MKTCGDCPWGIDLKVHGWIKCSVLGGATINTCGECPARRAFRVIRDRYRQQSWDLRGVQWSAVSTIEGFKAQLEEMRLERGE